MSKIKAATFYARQLFGGLFARAENFTKPQITELAYAEHCISETRFSIEVGPRLDTALAQFSISMNKRLDLFEASPTFCRKLKVLFRDATNLTVHNLGLSNFDGRTKYYILNQSFIKDFGFPSLGLYRKINITSLNEFYRNSNEYPQFLKSDAEGLDFQILEGASELIPNLSFVQLELNFHTSSGARIELSDYEKLLANFSLYLIGEHTHPLWKQLCLRSGLIQLDVETWNTAVGLSYSGIGFNLAAVKNGKYVPEYLLSTPEINSHI
jgi:FkbM family methyltransferase